MNPWFWGHLPAPPPHKPQRQRVWPAQRLRTPPPHRSPSAKSASPRGGEVNEALVQACAGATPLCGARRCLLSPRLRQRSSVGPLLATPWEGATNGDAPATAGMEWEWKKKEMQQTSTILTVGQDHRRIPANNPGEAPTDTVGQPCGVAPKQACTRPWRAPIHHRRHRIARPTPHTAVCPSPPRRPLHLDVITVIATVPPPPPRLTCLTRPISSAVPPALLSHPPSSHVPCCGYSPFNHSPPLSRAPCLRHLLLPP